MRISGFFIHKNELYLLIPFSLNYLKHPAKKSLPLLLTPDPLRSNQNWQNCKSKLTRGWYASPRRLIRSKTKGTIMVGRGAGDELSCGAEWELSLGCCPSTPACGTALQPAWASSSPLPHTTLLLIHSLTFCVGTVIVFADKLKKVVLIHCHLQEGHVWWYWAVLGQSALRNVPSSTVEAACCWLVEMYSWIRRWFYIRSGGLGRVPFSSVWHIRKVCHSLSYTDTHASPSSNNWFLLFYSEPR